MTTTKQLEQSTGGLGKPSKMPGYAYGLPAPECKLGSLLRKVKGSTCEGCYAMKGRYMFANVQSAEYRRLEATKLNTWARDMVELITRKLAHKSDPDRYFRWHDSGDVQSVEHVAKIMWIARRTPTVRYWLPTREATMVREFLTDGGEIPDNMTVRVSAPMVDKPAPWSGLPTSTVVTDKNKATCPARLQGNQCGDCRSCWDRSVDNMAYPQH